MKRYWYSTFLAASLAAVIAVEYVPGAVRKLTPWYEAGAMEKETDEGAAKKPDIGAERETREEEIPEHRQEHHSRRRTIFEPPVKLHGKAGGKDQSRCQGEPVEPSIF